MNKTLFLYFQILIIPCLSAQEKVVTSVIKEHSTQEPGWTWIGSRWHHSEKATDTIPFNYHVKTTTKTQEAIGGKIVNECQISEKDVSLSLKSSQPGWEWNSDRRIWLYNGSVVDASPGEYIVVLSSDITLSECGTGKTIERILEDQKIYYRLTGNGWQWDDQRHRWMLNGIVKTPEYIQTGTETQTWSAKSKS